MLTGHRRSQGKASAPSSDLWLSKAGPWHQKTCSGQERQAAVELHQALVQKSHQGSSVDVAIGRRTETCQRSPFPHSQLTRLLHMASQLGARASLELSLLSWLRLARRSLSKVSSCVRSVCAKTLRDSLCSTGDGKTSVGPCQATCLPRSQPSIGVAHWPMPHPLLLHLQLPWVPGPACPYHLGRQPGWPVPGR